MPRIIPGYVTVATIAAVMLSTLPAFASIESRTLTREGYRLAYALQFSNSLAVLEKACQADRHDAAAPRAIAAITWMEILFAQGAATFAAFDGDASSDDVIRPVAPAYLAERFIRHIEEAVQLAESGAAHRPQDIDAQYQLGATRGLLALYRGTVEGRAASAFSDGRRAVKAMTRILEKQPCHREAALIPGIYRYAVSTLSWPKRMAAAAAGMPADRGWRDPHARDRSRQPSRHGHGRRAGADDHLQPRRETFRRFAPLDATAAKASGEPAHSVEHRGNRSCSLTAC